MWNLMSDICGIDCAPLVLTGWGSYLFIALSGYANDYRTFGANFSDICANVTKSLAFGETKGI
jgi:hypothetical protein